MATRICLGFIAFLLASLGVRHAAYLLLRGSIFEPLRKWVKGLAERYQESAEPAQKYYENYQSRRRGKSKSLRRRVEIFRRRLRAERIFLLAWWWGKLDELFGCYVCMTAQLSIWLVAIPTTVLAFCRWGNPFSVLADRPLTLLATLVFAGLATFLLAMSVAALSVVFWHAIEFASTYETNRLNTQSAARALAMEQDGKLTKLTDLIRQLENTVNGLQKTIDTKPVIQVQGAGGDGEVPIETEPSHRFVETRGGGRYVFIDASGQRIGDTVDNLEDARFVYERHFRRGLFNEATGKFLLRQIDKVFDAQNKLAIPAEKKQVQFTLQDAQALVAAVAECDSITWCGFERRDCRTRKTSEFMAKWGRERGTKPNGVSEKVGLMMVDFFHARQRGRKQDVDIKNFHQKHFPTTN